VIARRPERAPPSSTIVPVSAIASAQPVSTPSKPSSSRGPSGGSSATSSRPSRSVGPSGGVTSRRAPRSAQAADTASGSPAALTRRTVAR